MTCIVGIKSEQGLFIGGDSAVSSANLVQTIADPKVWKKGQFIIGFAGSLRVGQIVKYNLKIPPFNKKEPTEYMVTAFVNAMRKALKNAGAAREHQKEEEQENQFLIGFKNRLFEIDEAHGVCEVGDEYISIGSGTEYALGSLHTTKGKPSEMRIIAALEAAAYFSEGVRPPFHMVNIKKK
jgi:ATP-dependent protease HslVU (ClpYQ) peptidase subunit